MKGLNIKNAMYLVKRRHQHSKKNMILCNDEIQVWIDCSVMQYIYTMYDVYENRNTKHERQKKYIFLNL